MKHITSLKELNAELARDPNSPVAHRAVQAIMVLMHTEGLSRQEALERFFGGNADLNERIGREVAYEDTRSVEFKGTMRAFAALVLLATVAMAIIYPAQDRALMLRVAVPVLGLVISSSTNAGFLINRALVSHPIHAAVLYLCIWYTVGLLGVFAVNWAMTPDIPGQDLADATIRALLPEALAFMRPEVLIALIFGVAAALIQPLWIRSVLVLVAFSAVGLFGLRFVREVQTAEAAPKRPVAQHAKASIPPFFPTPRLSEKQLQQFYRENLPLWVRAAVIPSIVTLRSLESLQAETANMDIGQRMDHNDNRPNFGKLRTEAMETFRALLMTRQGPEGYRWGLAPKNAQLLLVPAASFAEPQLNALVDFMIAEGVKITRADYESAIAVLRIPVDPTTPIYPANLVNAAAEYSPRFISGPK